MIFISMAQQNDLVLDMVYGEDKGTISYGETVMKFRLIYCTRNIKELFEVIESTTAVFTHCLY